MLQTEVRDAAAKHRVRAGAGAAAEDGSGSEE